MPMRCLQFHDCVHVVCRDSLHLWLLDSGRMASAPVWLQERQQGQGPEQGQGWEQEMVQAQAAIIHR